MNDFIITLTYLLCGYLHNFHYFNDVFDRRPRPNAYSLALSYVHWLHDMCILNALNIMCLCVSTDIIIYFVLYRKPAISPGFNLVLKFLKKTFWAS